MGDKRDTQQIKQVAADDLDETTDKRVDPFSAEKPASIIPWVIDLHIGERLLQVQVREQMIIGRGDEGAGSPDVDLSSFDARQHGISRRHAILFARKRFLTVQDLSSRNGTLLNGLRLQKNQDVPLEHGDVLQFGSLEARLMFAVLPPHKRATADSDYRTLKPILPGSGRHVLIVEDDADVALAYQMMLRSSGYRVTVAPDLNAAVEALSGAEMPAAVVIDLHLSSHGRDHGGLDVLQLLNERAERQEGRVPGIVISGQVDARTRERAMQAGASLFLPKPLRVDELAVRVGMMIRQMNSTSNVR